MVSILARSYFYKLRQVFKNIYITHKHIVSIFFSTSWWIPSGIMSVWFQFLGESELRVDLFLQNLNLRMVLSYKVSSTKLYNQKN